MPGVVASPPVHLRPNAPVAERALLPGDPGRALRLATALLEAPMKVLNTNRGLWGYTGTATDGQSLTIQSTGMGGPSAAIVAEELIGLGARRLVRVGTCRAVVDGLRLGELLVVEAALSLDGTSRALRAGLEAVQAGGGPEPAAEAAANGRVAPDPDLLAALCAQVERVGVVASIDLFYDGTPAERWAGLGALAVEMEAAALFQVARLRGAAAGAVLAVTDLPAGAGRQRIDDEALAAAEHELGRVALAALA
jgi:uridine phosphorylase